MINTYGKDFNNNLRIDGIGGEFTLENDFSVINGKDLLLVNGELILNGYDLTCTGDFDVQSGGTVTVSQGSDLNVNP